jgi:hypothetical protein
MKNKIIELGRKIEECKKYLFSNGFDYKESEDYVRLVFSETGFNYNSFDYIEKSEIDEVIEYLDNKILKS